MGPERGRILIFKESVAEYYLLEPTRSDDEESFDFLLSLRTVQGSGAGVGSPVASSSS
jgi:hypothetical protein